MRSANIVLRGHRDDSCDIEDSERNCGNFQALLDFRRDEVLINHFKTAPKNATYRSKTIQNEIIFSCGKFIHQKIAKEVNTAKFFSIVADEASDASHTEQLSVCVCKVVDSKSLIQEEFVEFIGCEKVNAESLVGYIKNALKKLHLPIKKFTWAIL